VERSVRVRWTIALIALGTCLVAASAMASGSAHRHQRTHRTGHTAVAPAVSTSQAPSITLSPSTVTRGGTRAFTTSISGSGFAADMPVTINTATLAAVCSSTGVRPDVRYGSRRAGATKAGPDGHWLASLDGVQCQPGVYAVAVQEQALPYQTFVATLTVIL
jgi:hypothetical protein